MSTWINFREFRKSLSFESVLIYYGVTIKRQRGNRHVGMCPLPTHRGANKQSMFSAKLDVGTYQCLSCGQGMVLHFAAVMEGLNPKNPNDLRKVAIKLRDAGLALRGTTKLVSPRNAKEPSLPVVVNPPLDFELQDLDYDHPYLKGRGFNDKTIRHFGLGFCNRGLMKGRVVIPLHNPDGRLVGYAGRVIDDNMISEDNPRYRLPGDRKRKDKVIEFKNSLLLYNFHRLKGPLTNLIVVDSFISAWWLHQCGYQLVVALTGSECSNVQAHLIVEATASDGHILIFTGENCAVSILSRVASSRWVRWVRLPRRRLTDYSPSDLEGLLTDTLICRM